MYSSDPELAARLLDEYREHIGDFEDTGDSLNIALLYVIFVVLNDSYIDYLPDNHDHEELSNLLKLPCGPLLAPYYEARKWTHQEVTALRVKERLKS